MVDDYRADGTLISTMASGHIEKAKWRLKGRIVTFESASGSTNTGKLSVDGKILAVDAGADVKMIFIRAKKRHR